jgi:AmmeMemoRadiSam system protein B/AmmeMemoRadiSam system protein A
MARSGLPRRILVALGVCALAAVVVAAERVRESALAGGWYPADPGQLQAQVDGFLEAAKVPAPEGRIRALITPHAGYAFSGPTAGQVFSLVKGQTYKRVLVLAPSHYGRFQGLSIVGVDAYRTPLGDVPLDLEAVQTLRRSPLVGVHADAHVREHSIEIELPLLQRALAPGWRLVPVLVGHLNAQDDQLAADLLRPLGDDTTLVVVSSDFTHYGQRFGYLPFPADQRVPGRIQALDDGAIRQILAKDADGFLAYQAQTGVTICGFRPIDVLLRMLGPGAEVHRVAYETSGTLTGDWDSSVSYVGLVVTDPGPLSFGAPATSEAPEPAQIPAQTQESRPASEEGLTDTELKQLHRLATLALEDAVLGRSPDRAEAVSQAVDALPPRLREPAGAFVTLKRQGALRGCIGYIEPREPLYRVVLENGDNAAQNDRRFPPVQASELSDLDVEVSVLSMPRPIASWEEFRVGEEGIVLTKAGRRAVFLPEVAVEQGWTREETLSHLARKAGLPTDGWRDGASFAVFTSTKYAARYAASSADRSGP